MGSAVVVAVAVAMMTVAVVLAAVSVASISAVYPRCCLLFLGDLYCC